MRVPAPPCGCDRVRVARACARVYACACAVSQGLMLLSMRTELQALQRVVACWGCAAIAGLFEGLLGAL